ncbi:MAG: hypothetical protein A2Y69_02815 [Candidatus Aminicenantes bacterium RBG_13_59_9]|nr:MAG: hypothetical protein A2Y69_02815 [Candidatus Aminicenantes bacterium RBG_13_59_9]
MKHESARVKPKKLSLLTRYIRHRPRRVHPYEVQACITNDCNMKCQYCACPNLPKDSLSTEEWKSVIRGLRRLGMMRLKFQGGEPTLRPDFDELAALGQELGLVTAVASNGTLIAENPGLIDHVHELILTLNSLNKTVQDDLRGEGSFEAILKTMDLAQARGVRVFNNMVVNKKNLSELESVLDFCEKRGVTFHAQAVVFGRSFFDDGAKHLQLSLAETQLLHRKLADWKTQGRNVLFSSQTYARASQWSDYDDLNRPGDRPSSCFAGRFYVHIEPMGEVYPCNLHIGSFQPKNAVRDGLVPALLHARKHVCSDCWHPYFNERKALFGLKLRNLRSAVSG